MSEKPTVIANHEALLRRELDFAKTPISERIQADAEIVENGLARLVLSIIELVRRLLGLSDADLNLKLGPIRSIE